MYHCSVVRSTPSDSKHAKCGGQSAVRPAVWMHEVVTWRQLLRRRASGARRRRTGAPCRWVCSRCGCPSPAAASLSSTQAVLDCLLAVRPCKPSRAALFKVLHFSLSHATIRNFSASSLLCKQPRQHCCNVCLPACAPIACKSIFFKDRD